MSKRRHNFGTKRFKEKSLFIFHARIALKSLILLFVRLIARGARIGKTHAQTGQVLNQFNQLLLSWGPNLGIDKKKKQKKKKTQKRKGKKRKEAAEQCTCKHVAMRV